MATTSGLEYGVICGDCRDTRALAKLLGGRKANAVITSPPYASQREYDASSGFKPIPPAEYTDWYKGVADGIESILAPDGSYFLNIKEHADGGERSLYVKDLVLAHKRSWGWRFVDEFCWRNTGNGVPGRWPNRFKNAWEPVFHFSRQGEIKFRPANVQYESDSVMSGTGCEHADGRRFDVHGSASVFTGASKPRVAGMALPSNVIEVKCETGQGEHSAPYPRALVEFFIKAFTDPGDVIFDPFLGSGTTMIAAMALGRSCYGTEISPRYCDVIVKRAEAFHKSQARLAGDGRTFEEMTTARHGAVAA